MGAHPEAGPHPRPAIPSTTDPSLSAVWLRLSLSLSFVTGMVDIMAYLTLSKFFVTAITGDLILGVSDLVRHVTPNALLILMVPVYLCGIVLAYFIARLLGLGGVRMLRALLITETVFFGCALVTSVADPSSGHAGSPYSVVIGVCAIVAVAVQNTAMKMADPNAPTTWAMTANTVHCTVAALDCWFQRGAERASSRQQVRQTLPAIFAWVLGGLIGTFATIAVHDWCWAIPFLAFCLLSASVWQRTGRVERQAADSD